MSTVARRGLVAAGCTVLSLAGPVPASAAPAAPPAPSEVTVVPAYTSTDILTDLVVFAGRTGFLHQYSTNAPWLWTRYSDGVTRTVPDLAGVTAPGLDKAGGDRVRVKVDVPGHTVAGAVNLLDLTTGDWLHPALPDDGTFVTFSGDTMVVRLASTGGPVLRRFATDGTFTTIPITGLPEGATAVTAVAAASDAGGIVVSFQSPGVTGRRFGLVDYATGRVGLIPAMTGAVQPAALLSSTHIAFRINTDLKVFARSEIMDGTAGEPAVIAQPNSGTMALVGDRLLVRATAYGSARVPVRLLSADGTEQQVIEQSPGVAYSMVASPVGALVLGGSGPEDWAVRQVTPQGVTPVLSEVRTAVNAGVTLHRGLLRHVRATARPGEATVYDFSNHQVFPPGTGPGGYGGTMPDATPCAVDVACVRTIDGSRSGTVHVSAGATSTTVHYRFAGPDGWNALVPAGGGRLVDVSENYTLVDTTSPAKQYLIRNGGSLPPVERPITGAALWLDTLWTAGPGTIQAKNLAADTTSPAISIGAPCTPSEVQANARQVLWSCGPDGPSGVYNLGPGNSLSLPAGQYSLGDGFAVRHDLKTNRLLRYDLSLRSLPNPVTLGTVDRNPALADDRNITWTVDRFGGDVAYVDAANAVHVIDPALPGTPPSVIYTGDSTDVVNLSYEAATKWARTFALSRPVSAWQATITEIATGGVAATRSGGATARDVVVSWDGLLPDKKAATSGMYRITLSATTPDGVTTTAGTSTVPVWGGAPKLHSYTGDGLPSVLAVRESDEGDWWITQRGRTSLYNWGYTDNWDIGPGNSQVSALVPFGDLNSDRRNDVLARTGNGYLWGYPGDTYPGTSALGVVKIGSGWNRFDSLLTSGDLTGDGNADLLARDAKTGELYRYNGTGKKSFASGVKLSGSYKGLKLIGPGDITGDGRADLLVIDSKGNLYRKAGTGAGTFGANVKIGSGYAGYNAVIGIGDLNEDGHNDLLLRDTAGKLYRQLGTGKGTFAARQQIGTGYQKYQYLF
ncbi:FG-GAP-like repeat-containing protein [Actinoplanes siamensis]|uniref:VCBS repeat protein n=1 Tax=Actinoplanes siamensis TaxID=1223317 RepID=A0A919NF53_9ACTN|nr:FG-GAP-like repeat-containing protein [Actinoplanes siamensis]GIF09545.1 hypothetical protein Asi03nite_70830 [Actinoplanes siamensis]